MYSACSFAVASDIGWSMLPGFRELKPSAPSGLPHGTLCREKVDLHQQLLNHPIFMGLSSTTLNHVSFKQLHLLMIDHWQRLAIQTAASQARQDRLFMEFFVLIGWGGQGYQQMYFLTSRRWDCVAEISPAFPWCSQSRPLDAWLSELTAATNSSYRVHLECESKAPEQIECWDRFPLLPPPGSRMNFETQLSGQHNIEILNGKVQTKWKIQSLFTHAFCWWKGGLKFCSPRNISGASQ